MMIATLILVLVAILISICIFYPDGVNIATSIIVILTLYSMVRIWPMGEKLIESKSERVKTAYMINNIASFAFTVYSAISIAPRNMIIFIMILTVFIAPIISKGAIKRLEFCENEGIDFINDTDFKVWVFIAIFVWFVTAIIMVWRLSIL